MEARLRRCDGADRWFLLRICPMDDESGKAARWCGMSTDIEDRKRAEEAQRMRDAHYRAMADSIPAQIAVMAPAGQLESVNRHFLEFIGGALGRLKGLRTSD